MTNDLSETMLIAGQAGGKSTFIGSLIAYVNDIAGDKWHGQHSLRYGQTTEFRNHIRDRIESHKEYPDQTRQQDSYIVEVKINTGLDFAPERGLVIMDLPGEVQEDATVRNTGSTTQQSAIDKLVNGNWDPEEVDEQYNQGINNLPAVRQKIEDGKGLSQREKECTYLYRYKSSERVIFLLNLHKFLNRPNLEPVLTPALLEQVSQEKTCLLLVTAADLIGYDPDQFRSGALSDLFASLSVSPTLFDLDFYEYVHDGNLPPAKRASDIKSLLDTAKNNDISMFSIAVPEGQQGIEVENGSIKTQGFDNVVDWLTSK